MVGLGRAGAAAARALATHAEGSLVRAWDAQADAAQLARAAGLRALGVEVVLGGDGLEALAGVGSVVKSPGVPPEVPVLAAAARRGLLVIDELDLGWRLVPAPTVAVTGTNGKSTVAALCVAALAEHGLEPVLSGNTDFGPPLSELSLGPPPRSVVAEVSSYQAESSPALAVDGAVFTNLTPDHLNRHRTMEAYAAAKRALFVREDGAVPVVATNLDDRLGRALAAEVEERGGRAVGYGCSEDAEFRIAGCRWDLHGAELEIDSPDGALNLATALPGPYNAANATSVLALGHGLGLAAGPTLAALSAATPIRGRFEVVDVGRPFDVVVDFAYSVDSVAAVLAMARALVEPRGGRLVTVLGIVGRAGRLTGREVGRVAREGSDHLVLSGASYRGESRLLTLEQLAAGARAAAGGSVEIVIDRRQAIGRALAAARPGDLVVILGRGPIDREATDARGGGYLLDDRQAARELA
ncbi:MAG TPA: Mur ligase family protein [Solirubrobacterales bacterium]|nr:Mur ligase family protein [Solirubrobacterales bacterium]